MKAAPSLELEELLDEIKDQIKKAPIEVVEVKTRNPQLQSHLYLVSFTNGINLNELQNITGLNNVRVKWVIYVIGANSSGTDKNTVI